MEQLGKLFGSMARVKIMRLFLFNPETPFDQRDVAVRSSVRSDDAAAELKLLEQSGLINRRSFVREHAEAGTDRIARNKVNGWELNAEFQYLPELKALLVHSVLFTDGDIMERLERAGTLKFVAVAGVFIHNPESRIDLLIVGDRLKEKVIEGVVRSLEAEIGKELRYSILETEDFKYRLGVFDRLVRDILDYPHRTILDRVGVKAR